MTPFSSRSLCHNNPEEEKSCPCPPLLPRSTDIWSSLSSLNVEDLKAGFVRCALDAVIPMFIFRRKIIHFATSQGSREIMSVNKPSPLRKLPTPLRQIYLLGIVGKEANPGQLIHPPAAESFLPRSSTCSLFTKSPFPGDIGRLL